MSQLTTFSETLLWSVMHTCGEDPTESSRTHSFSLSLQVMEDDAEVFILKLWRLLIYETEAKHLGIAKSY